jgi:expansin (peptidoglycan-binding protein)
VVVFAVVVCACRGSHAIDGGGSAAACAPIPADESGNGTYYAADGTGNCSFDASPNDLMVAAMNAPDYNHAAWCGACVAVTGPNGQVVVRVVDQCPGCAHGDLDLSQQAFQMIAPLSAGRVPITWHEVACDVTGPIAFRLKEGSNASWIAIQLRNHRYPIAKLEAQKSDGSYAAIARADYNYFVAASGLGAGPFVLRTTDTRGHVLDDSSIALGAAVVRTGAAQFASCP